MSKRSAYRGVWYALLFSNLACLLFLVLRILETGTGRYFFMVWNLFLAWLPFVFGLWLIKRLRHGHSWKTPGNIALSVLWLAFLPNSFYMVSDLIHIHATGEINLLYDVVMMSFFVFNAYIAGLISLLLVHAEMIRRLGRQRAHWLVAVIILACSFAIYLGRSLRWNSWDLLLHPIGILFDVSDRIIDPASHPQAFVTTLVFFLFIGSIYTVIWQIVQALRSHNR